jgi:hypothetical protein
MAQQDPIATKALAAYEEHQRIEAAETLKKKRQITNRKILRLRNFMKEIGEEIDPSTPLQIPQITKGIFTFGIENEEESDGVIVSYRCNLCGQTRMSGRIADLIGLGDFLAHGCKCQRIGNRNE